MQQQAKARYVISELFGQVDLMTIQFSFQLPSGFETQSKMKFLILAALLTFASSMKNIISNQFIDYAI